MEKISVLYKNGESINNIAKIIGISKNKCYKNAHNENLQLDNRKFRCKDNFFSNYTAESCYWAGFIAADGCIFKNTIKISISTIDHNHLNKFKEVILFTGILKQSCRKNKFYSTITITSKQMIKDLLCNFNITNKKSLTLKPPEKLDESMLKHFIRGYIDGDGCIYAKKYSISIIGSKYILEWIKHIFQTKLLTGNPKIHKIGNVYSIIFAGINQFNKITKFLYESSTNNIRLDRKYILTTYKSPKIIKNNEIENKIINLYTSGKSINQIIKLTKFGYFKIYRILSDGNIKIRKTNKKPFPENLKNKVIELRKNKETIKNIAKLVGISNVRISEFFREFFK